MKTRSWILGAVATATGIVTAQAQVTIGYNFTAGTTAPSSGTPVNFVVSSVSIGNVNGTIGITNPDNTAGVTAASSGYAGASGTFAYNNAAVTAAFNSGTSSFYSITVTPSPGFGIRLTDFDFGNIRTATGPVNYALRWSVDSFGADLAGTTGTIGTSWALANNTPTVVTSTAANGPVTFRLYTFNGSGGTANTSNVRLDDIALTVQAVPEASDCALYGCAAIVGFTWWRRSKKSVKQA